jgi:site-specific recombinase XerD
VHPDFTVLIDSWLLAMEADGYAPNTRTSYGKALDSLTASLPDDVAPEAVTRDHVRGWLVSVRSETSSSTARSWLAGVRHFFRWALVEGEISTDPTTGIKTPLPDDPKTSVLAERDIRRLLDTTRGSGFVNKRDRALLLVFIDGGLRLAEATGLRVEDVDVRERILFVAGKGSRRSGPRRRAVPVGVKTAQALDRYLRERRHHPHRDNPALWLGDRNRGPLSTDAVKATLQRRGASVGITLHPHMFRHTWASQFRAAGGSEGDLMVLGGWRSRAMLDRYGSVVAADRARDAYRKLSLGDRL